MEFLFYTIATILVLLGILAMIGLAWLALWMLERRHYVSTGLVVFAMVLACVMSHFMEEDAAQWIKQGLGIPCYKNPACKN